MLSEQHRLNLSQALQGKPVGRKIPETVRIKMSISHQGKSFSLEHRKNISKVTSGNKHPMFGKHHTSEAIEAMKEKLSGKNNPMYGKSSPHAKGGRYKEIYFRSTWEITFAKWLDAQGYHWKYEPERFFFQDKPFSYCPDFWVEELQSYVEIKGTFKRNKDDLEKVNLFLKKAPLIVITNINPFEVK